MLHSLEFCAVVICLKFIFYRLIFFCRYDSVTIDGKLDWQDQLNEKNKPFFDICDGIFVNYTWEVSPYLYPLYGT